MILSTFTINTNLKRVPDITIPCIKFYSILTPFKAWSNCIVISYINRNVKSTVYLISADNIYGVSLVLLTIKLCIGVPFETFPNFITPMHIAVTWSHGDNKHIMFAEISLRSNSQSVQGYKFNHVQHHHQYQLNSRIHLTSSNTMLFWSALLPVSISASLFVLLVYHLVLIHVC